MLILADDYLRDYVGHSLEYARSLHEACRERGCGFVALGRRDLDPRLGDVLPLVPTFRHAGNATVFRIPGLRQVMDTLFINACFHRDLGRALASLAPTGATLFLPNATHRQMLGAALLLARTPARAVAQTVLLFRYAARDHSRRDAWKPSAGLARLGFRLLEWAARRRKVRIVTDSESLAREYRALTRLPVEVVPIPHTPLEVPADAPPLPSPPPVRFAMLGEARDNKGFPLLVDAIEALGPRLAAGAIALTVQCHIREGAREAASLAARERLERMSLPNLRLIDAPIDTAAYHGLLFASHAILVPYRRADYASQTSGIFTEAVAAGKPVVVTGETWMAEEALRLRCGATFRDGDAGDLARAIVEVAEDHPALEASTRRARETWLGFHNAANLCRALLEG